MKYIINTELIKCITFIKLIYFIKNDNRPNISLKYDSINISFYSVCFFKTVKNAFYLRKARTFSLVKCIPYKCPYCIF